MRFLTVALFLEVMAYSVFSSCFSTSCSKIQTKYRPNTVWIHNGKDGGHHQLSHRAKNGKFCTINYSRKACSHKNENPQQRSTASEHTILYYDPFVNTKGFFLHGQNYGLHAHMKLRCSNLVGGVPMFIIHMYY